MDTERVKEELKEESTVPKDGGEASGDSGRNSPAVGGGDGKTESEKRFDKARKKRVSLEHPFTLKS